MMIMMTTAIKNMMTLKYKSLTNKMMNGKRKTKIFNII